MARYISATEAADTLGVNVQTIYAYVSRGMIRSEETSGSKRNRRYYAEDIERLLMNKEASRNPDKAASEALHWGMPLLESGITLITGDRLYYRGQDALMLAKTQSYEQVVSSLWLGEDQAGLINPPSQEFIAQTLQRLHRLDPIPRGVQALQIAVTLAGEDDVTAYDLSQEGIIRSGIKILYVMAAVMLGHPIADQSLARAIAETWCTDNKHAERIINAALILCADHELNASSFTARVIAGAAASPYAVVTGALSAFQGVKHGSATERAGLFLAQSTNPEQVRTVIADWLRREGAIPGFGHPLYPGGDPRAAALLSILERDFPDNPSLAIIKQSTTLVERPPNIDIALASMAATLGFSPMQGSLIFALGRTAGWIAHAIEQYDSRMIRPRARYVGVQPES